MKVAGIDFSTNAIDVVLLDLDDTEPLIWQRFLLAGQDAFDRTRRVAAVMPARTSVWWDDILAVGIEHPAGRYGVGDMLRVQGAVLSMIPAGLLVKAWPPAQWKHRVGLSGNATKEQVRAFGLDAFGGEYRAPATQDCFDAYCIALATRQALDIEAAA